MPIEIMNVMEHFAHPTGQNMKILVAGPPGAGKTRFASTFPNVIYADAEGHLLSVRDRPVRAVAIETIKDLEDLRAELDQRPDIRAKRLGGPVDTVCLDTIDHVAKLMMRERLKAERKEVFAQQDWGIHGDRLRDILRGFRNLDMNVLINVHLRQEKDEDSGRISYRPAIQGAVGGEIGEYTDECFLLVRRTVTDPATGDRRVTRVLQTYADSQHDWLKDHSGALPMELPIDFETDYERLAKLIFGGIPAPTPRPSVRVQEIADWQPTESDLIDANAPDAPVVEEPPAKPVKRPAKKKARSQLDTSDGLLQGEAPQGDVIGQPVPEPETHPDTSVPETGTETTEPAAEPTATPEATEPEAELADPNAKACAVCGTTDINEDYLELSEARWGEYLCRQHFLERNKQK